MPRKGGSLFLNNNVNQYNTYYYYGLLFLAIVLLLLLFRFVGNTLYYRGPRAKPKPTPIHTPTHTPIPSTTGTPSITPTTTITTSVSRSESMIKPNVLPSETITPKPTNKNPLNLDEKVLAIVKGRLIDLGDNYNKLTNDDKKEVGSCYANPNGCQF